MMKIQMPSNFGKNNNQIFYLMIKKMYFKFFLSILLLDDLFKKKKIKKIIGTGIPIIFALINSADVNEKNNEVFKFFFIKNKFAE